MELEKIQKIEQSVSNLENKQSRIYFLVQDTKGNPRASIKHIYEMALTLRNNGYNSIIMNETNDYKGVGEWLGEEYMEIPHQVIEGQNLPISPEDFVVIPELYGHVMDQIKNLPCGKIVLCQSYDYMLETLPPGVSWSQYGFIKCITTSEYQKEYINQIMRNVSIDVLPVDISENFSRKTKPSKPIIAIHTREPRDTAKIIKTFYLKYPQFRWITFRDMRGITQKDFADFLKDSFVSVWVDNESAFGTFPIESMLSGTPVIGKVPSLKPDWMSDTNGVWTYQFNEIVDILSTFTQNWLEDNISETLYDGMYETAKEFQDKEKFENNVVSLFDSYFKVRLESFTEQLEKIKVEQ